MYQINLAKNRNFIYFLQRSKYKLLQIIVDADRGVSVVLLLEEPGVPGETHLFDLVTKQRADTGNQTWVALMWDQSVNLTKCIKTERSMI